MLPGVSGTELLILCVVALVVVGPKDLPMLMRKVGQLIAKARSMAADFRSSFDEMSRQAELDDLRKEVEQLRHTRLPDVLGKIDTGLETTVQEIRTDLDATSAQLDQGLLRGTEATPLAPEYAMDAPPPAPLDLFADDMHPGEGPAAEVEPPSTRLEDPAPIVRAGAVETVAEPAAKAGQTAAAGSAQPPPSYNGDAAA